MTMRRSAYLLLALAAMLGSAAARPAADTPNRAAPMLAARTLEPVEVMAPLQVRQRDPLTEKEVDDLREVAQEPDKRLKLLVKYARARMAAVDQVRGDPKLAADRGKQMHDLLDDFGGIMDEIDDNLDDYERRNLDMRKGLKELIEADSEFQLKLRALKEAAEGASAEEARDYSFVLQNVVETVNTQLDTARQMLQDQEQRLKEEKKKKK